MVGLVTAVTSVSVGTVVSVVVVLSVLVVVSPADSVTASVSVAASSGEEHAAKRTSCSMMDSEKRTERVCFRTLLGGKKDDGTIPLPPD